MKVRDTIIEKTTADKCELADKLKDIYKIEALIQSLKCKLKKGRI